MSKNEEFSLKLNNSKSSKSNKNSKNIKTKTINKSSNKSNNKSQNTSSKNNNDIFSLSKEGNEIDLTGKDLSSKEGQSLINSIISRNKSINKLILNNCNLTSLPKDLSNLNKLTSLDICNNKFENFTLLIEDLSKINNLVELQINLENQNQVLQILSNLPKLTMLNEKPTKSSFSIVDVEYKDIEDISLSNNLDYYNEIIRYLSEKDNNNNFANKFQNKINEEGEKINNSLDKNIPNYIYANITLKSQLELQKCLTEKYLEYLDKNNQTIGNYIFKIIFQTAEKLVNLINNLYPKIIEKTDNLRNEIENARKAVKELSDYDSNYNDMKNNKLILETNLDLLQKKFDKLENENKFITQILEHTPKNISKNNYLTSTNKNYSYTINYINRIFNKMNTEANNRTFRNIKNQQFNTFNPNISDNQNQINFLNINNNFPSDINNNMNSNSTNYNPQVNNIFKLKSKKNRISINVAKDLINELYNSKENYDKICYENKLPNETMEHYVYIYLNNKYGLKNLVLDWASAIANAVEIYSKIDCDINLFGKILKNEQEEKSRFILVKIKESIASLLEYFYKLKNEYKQKEDIDKEMDKKKKGLLLEEEWREIIQYMYNEEDAQIIENKILKFIKEQNDKIFSIIENGEDLNNDRFITYQNTNSIKVLDRDYYSKKLKNNIPDVFLTDKKKITREIINDINRLKEEINIPYKDFVQLVCENQIENRQNYLKRFVELFKKYDTDEDGILNEEEFLEMIKSIPYCLSNLDYYIEYFLNRIDPFNHRRFIFNDCVNAFSSEIIDYYDETQSDFNKGNNDNENLNIGLNIQNETTLLDKICLGN